MSEIYSIDDSHQLGARLSETCSGNVARSVPVKSERRL